MFENARVEPNTDNLKKIFDQYFDALDGHNINYDTRYIVLMLWQNPINGGLDKRSGCFEEYFEASIFKNMLKKTGDKFDYPYAIIVNGRVEINHNFKIEDGKGFVPKEGEENDG